MITSLRKPHFFTCTYSALSRNAHKLRNDEYQISHIVSFDNNNDNSNDNNTPSDQVSEEEKEQESDVMKTHRSVFHLLNQLYGYSTITHFSIKNRKNIDNKNIDNKNSSFNQMVRFISRSLMKNENILFLSLDDEQHDNDNDAMVDVRPLIALLSYMIAREHSSMDESLNTLLKHHEKSENAESDENERNDENRVRRMIEFFRDSPQASNYREQVQQFEQKLQSSSSSSGSNRQISSSSSSMDHDRRSNSSTTLNESSSSSSSDAVKMAQMRRAAIMAQQQQQQSTQQIDDNDGNNVDKIEEENDQKQKAKKRNENTNFDNCYCQKCRFPLFEAKSDLVRHTSAKGAGKKDFSYKKMKKDAKSFSSSLKQGCNAYYIERKPWMNTLDRDSGDINCPKCAHRIGAFAWSGIQCSCGVWVRPAIQILKSRVDVD